MVSENSLPENTLALPSSEVAQPTEKVLQPFKNKAPQKKAVKVGFIFIGGCGCNNGEGFMQDAPPTDWPHIGILLMNSDAAQLSKIMNPEAEHDNKKANFDFEDTKKKTSKLQNLKAWTSSYGTEKSQLSVLQLGADGDGAGADPHEGERLAKLHADEIEAWMNPFDLIVIVAGAGKGTGGGATPVVQAIAVKKGKYPLVLITLPFKDYGRGIMAKAIDALKSLYKGGGTTWAIYNDNTPEDVLKESPVIMFDTINRASTLPVLFGSREVTQVVGKQNADTADWKKTIERGNVSIIYYAKWSSGDEGGGEKGGNPTVPDTLETFTERLLNGNPYQDTKHKDKITTMIPCFHGDFPQFAQNQILGAITETIIEDKKTELEIFPFVNPVNDGEKWAMIFCTAKVEDPMSLAGKNSAATIQVAAPQTNGSALNEPPLPISERTETIFFATSYSGNTVAKAVTPATADLWRKAIGVPMGGTNGKVQTSDMDIPVSMLIELVKRETGEHMVYHPKLSMMVHSNSNAA
jgi:hypothetical protein